MTITIRSATVGSEARGCTPYIFHVQNVHFYVDFSIDGHLKNGHLLSTSLPSQIIYDNIRPIIGISSYIYINRRLFNAQF